MTGRGPEAEVERLYRQHASGLQRLVRCGVGAQAATIEDACQVAWSRLLDRRYEVRDEAVLPWLARTAAREAARLDRRLRRELSLDEMLESAGDAAVPRRAPGADELAEQRERLAGLSGLPLRQRRLMWLQGLGLSYAEMARHERCTLRTVERQLLRGKRTARELG